MSEEYLNIPTPDYKVIHGKYISTGEDDPLAIIGHGSNSDMDHPLLQYLACSLPREGIGTYRYNYYGYEDDARNQVDCTLATYADDLGIIVEHFSGKEVFLVGHSFGGLAVLLYLEATRNKSRNVQGVVLLDPSHPEWHNPDAMTYIDQEDLYVNRRGKGGVCGGEYVRHFSGLKPGDYLTDYSTPTLIIDAGDGALCATNAEYAERMGPDATLYTVEGADHNFSQPGNVEEIVAAIPAWMKRQARMLE